MEVFQEQQERERERERLPSLGGVVHIAAQSRTKQKTERQCNCETTI